MRPVVQMTRGSGSPMGRRMRSRRKVLRSCQKYRIQGFFFFFFFFFRSGEVRVVNPFSYSPLFINLAVKRQAFFRPENQRAKGFFCNHSYDETIDVIKLNLVLVFLFFFVKG